MATVGQHIRDARKRAGLTLRELADRVGTGFSHLAQIERGEIAPRVDTLNRLASALGTSAESLMSAPTRASGGIPVINRSPAGPPVRYESEQCAEAEMHDAWTYIDRGGINDPAAFAIEVIETSMEPTLFAGDVVVLLPVTEEMPRRELVRDGAIVLVCLSEDAPTPGTAFCRLRLRGDGQMLLLKDNPRHPPLHVEREWIVQMSVAIEVRRKL